MPDEVNAFLGPNGDFSHDALPGRSIVILPGTRRTFGAADPLESVAARLVVYTKVRMLDPPDCHKLRKHPCKARANTENASIRRTSSLYRTDTPVLTQCLFGQSQLRRQTERERKTKEKKTSNKRGGVYRVRKQETGTFAGNER